MKEQAQMMNQQHQQKMMNMNPNQNQHQQPPPQQQQVIKPPLIPKQPPLSSSTTMMNNYPVYTNNYLKNPQSNNLQMMMMNQPPPPLMNRSYGLWPPPLPPSSSDPMNFQNPNPNLKAGGGGGGGGYLLGGKQQHLGSKPLGPGSNWKGKKFNDKRKDGRRNENINMSLMAGSSNGGSVGGVGYTPPTLNELQQQNRVKARRFFTKKKFHPYPYHYNNNNNNNGNGNNRGKFAPRNTSSFIIRAKKSGGIAELVSPCPVTPAVLPTPMFSPSREVLVDMAKEEWGVDGYGSMKGLIRLRSPGREDEGHEGDEEDEEGGSSESDVEEHVEVERRLDHDLNRFEMIYPSYAGGMDYNNVLENRVDDQDTHIAQLEEENLILKERLFLMEREFGELRRRLQCLERQSNGGGEEINEEVMENESDNDSESGGEAHSVGDNNEEFIEGDVKEKEDTSRENNEVFVENTRYGFVKGNEETADLEHEVDAGNDKVKDENDAGHSKVKGENMGEDAVVKEDNTGKVENEVMIDEEVNAEGSEIAAVGGDISMKVVVGQAETDDVVIAENLGKEN